MQTLRVRLRAGETRIMAEIAAAGKQRTALSIDANGRRIVRKPPPHSSYDSASPLSACSISLRFSVGDSNSTSVYT